ncbi:proline-rich receptor-like protein kinase PERK10 isoform X2 [Quercus robur]|uniref:proline-rich receptor-like protein kinase PERK10 isoform X2 n=1 Tax=Quercus robur TaxID=38942 RepID=UPI0021617D26|nr:proline-rich receptor-like protein kinase PERK10 isoform X2 [Quercus robur]
MSRKPSVSSSSSSSSSHGPSRGGKYSVKQKYGCIADNFNSLEQVIAALRREGLETTNLIIGIDFTASNGETGKFSFNNRSLHTVGDTPNPYENAISIIGNTLSRFSKDNLIHCFGFGDASTQDQEVFSFHSDHSPCRGFEEVLSCYKKIVPNLKLAGPTSYAPIIEAAIDIVEKSCGKHHVLLLIADGQVTRSINTRDTELSPQEEKTINSIVRASLYPLSIVLVGVGDGPWEGMKNFDDKIPQREFDNFQFVNFTAIMSKNVTPSEKETAFSLAALMEIPIQYKAAMELGILGHVKGRANTYSHTDGGASPQPQGPKDEPFDVPDSEKQMPSPSLGSSPKAFLYEDLAKATNNFSESCFLGEGGFGSVYKGILSDGKLVAVKQLKSGSVQGEKEFRAEVNIISCIHHKNLVSLAGYCIDGAHRMLVYDFVPNKTLDFHLHGKGEPTMIWPNRMKIARGAAKGLAYLLEDCQPKIIHRDIKAANILIDDNFDAKVADFGLARFLPDADAYYSTIIMGTPGYVDPTYFSHGQLTDKLDVYSFGVVLLELITGLKPIGQNQPFSGDNMVEWAKPLLLAALKGKKFDALVDKRLEKNFVSKEMDRMVICAAKCVCLSYEERPGMSQILRELEGDLSQAVMVDKKGFHMWRPKNIFRRAPISPNIDMQEKCCVKW